jgi:2-polyprenyl-3-methyl-5-hydroxy-6-metoxy-1,4-benzoquinol methylase
MNCRDLASEIAVHYDAIAALWDAEQKDSSYGTEALMRAITMCGTEHKRRNALDIGCGSGGRMVRLLEGHAFQVTGLDCSEKMLAIAHEQHPAGTWLHGDIIHWKTSERYDLILAWDSIFHVPFDKQEDVLDSICGSSLGIEKNLDILSKNECQLRHLELDQFPLKHCIIIAKKM